MLAEQKLFNIQIKCHKYLISRVYYNDLWAQFFTSLTAFPAQYLEVNRLVSQMPKASDIIPIPRRLLRIIA